MFVTENDQRPGNIDQKEGEEIVMERMLCQEWVCHWECRWGAGLIQKEHQALQKLVMVQAVTFPVATISQWNRKQDHLSVMRNGEEVLKVWGDKNLIWSTTSIQEQLVQGDWAWYLDTIVASLWLRSQIENKTKHCDHRHSRQRQVWFQLPWYIKVG